MNTLEEMVTLHICILVEWQIPNMFTLTLPSHALSLDDINNESWYFNLFFWLNIGMDSNPFNTVTCVVTIDRTDLAQKTKAIFHLYYSKL